MEDFDKLMGKTRSYHSPLDIDTEWKSLMLKKENNLLRKKVIKKNIILLISLLLVICFLGAWFYNGDSNNSQKKESILSQKKKEKVETDIEIVNNNLRLSETDIKSDFHSIQKLKKHDADIDSKTKNSPRSFNNIVSLLKTNSSLDRNLENVELKEKIKKDYPISTNHVNTFKEYDFKQRDEQSQDYKVENSSEEIDFITKSKYDLAPKVSQKKQVIETSKEKYLSKIEENNNKTKEENKYVELPIKKLSDIRLEPTEAFPLPSMTKMDLVKNIDKKNFILFELFGQGGFYSFNYGRRIAKQRIGVTDVRVGLSLNPKKIYGRETSMFPLLIPISINQTFYLKTNHHLTVGLGSTLVKDRFESETNKYYLIGNIKLGYKFHRKGKRFFYTTELLSSHEFRYIFSGQGVDIPRFKRTDSFISGGVGIGYTF